MLFKQSLKQTYKKNVENVLKILKDKDMAKLKCRADFGGIILLDSTSAKKKRGPVHKDGNLHCSDQSFEQRFLDGRFEKSFLQMNKNLDQELIQNKNYDGPGNQSEQITIQNRVKNTEHTKIEEF